MYCRGKPGTGFFIMSYNLLSQSAFWMTSKKLAKKVGINAALLLADLITKMEYFEDKQEITDDGFFFNTADNIQKDTTLTPYQQRKALNILKKAGFIETKLIGLPAKQGFKILKTPLSKFLETSSKKTKELINNNKINNNKKIIKKEDKSSKKAFPKKLSLQKITKTMFEDFWKLYPRKVNKGTAKKAWEKLCSKKLTDPDRPTWREIKRAVYAQKKTKQWQNKTYIPHPATWLNNYRWLDGVEALNENPWMNKESNQKTNQTPAPSKGEYEELTPEEQVARFKQKVLAEKKAWKKEGRKPMSFVAGVSFPNSEKLNAWASKIFQEEMQKWEDLQMLKFSNQKTNNRNE